MPRTSPYRRILATGSGPSFGDDQIFARLHTVGIQAALSILISVLGLGSAMAQSIDQDMTFGADTRATRDRVISELRQARTDGTIKRWSPILIEVPYKAPLKGSRFEPFVTHQSDDSSNRFVPGDSAMRATANANVAAHAAQ